MSQLAKIKESATPAQLRDAANVATILSARGFEADDLEEAVFRIAEFLGEKKGRDPAEKDTLVNAELSAADELNMMSMEDQLVLIAAYHGTVLAFHAAIEKVLSISLEAESAPLTRPLPPLATPDAGAVAGD